MWRSWIQLPSDLRVRVFLTVAFSVAKTCTLGFRQVRSNADELSEIYRKMDSSLYESEVFGRFKTAARHFRMVQRLCPPGRILDVGCASGLFLNLALNEGWSGAGLEPSETLSRKAQAVFKDRAEIQPRTLEQAALPPHSFDVITLWDVLEHVPLPVIFLQQCHLLLKPGGHLFLNVPNLDSQQAKWLGSRWPIFARRTFELL
jgi:2-polyprenyl-3-methyl-5-hydroxy-6-metoxy-1,4-benzoquinol methylase